MNSMKTKIDPASYAAALLRLSLGAVMLAHAAAKLFVFSLPGTAAFFAANGFPGWTAYPVFLLEAAGGVALVLGWKTRIFSVALVPVMIGAAAVHFGNGWMFSASSGGWEYPVFLISALVVQSLLGDGAFALSHWLCHAPAAPSTRPVLS